jgi:hypothetical protein
MINARNAPRPHMCPRKVVYQTPKPAGPNLPERRHKTSIRRSIDWRKTMKTRKVTGVHYATGVPPEKSTFFLKYNMRNQPLLMQIPWDLTSRWGRS